MTWNWQQSDWPHFSCDVASVAPLGQRFLQSSGEVIGAVRHFSEEDRSQLRIELLSDEAIKTSEIEGEYLDTASVQSSLRRQFGLATDNRPVRRQERGIAEMVADVYKNWSSHLHQDALFGLHSMLIYGNHYIETIGSYRRQSRNPPECPALPLFHAKVSLTDAGQRFFARLGPSLDELTKATEELGDFNATPSGTIRINADATAAEQVLRPLVLTFMAAFSELQIEIVSERRLVDLAEGGFDCGIRPSGIVSEDMIAVPLGPMRQLVVVAAPTYLETAPPSRTPADLVEYRCIQFRMPTGRLYRWEFEHHGEALVIETKGSPFLDNSRLILAAAFDGYGLGYLTRWMAGPALDEGLRRQVFPEWIPSYPGLFLYYPRHRHLSATMRAFVTYLREQASHFPADA